MSGLKNLRVLTWASLLTAIGIIAGFFKIPITNVLEIRFTALPLAAAGTLFGPPVAAVVGILTDIGGFIIKPTGPYFPGFTLSSALSGVIFGLCLHMKKGGSPGILRISAAVLINTLIINLLLNSLWLALLYGGGGFIAVMSARLLKELIMIPVNIILIAAVTKGSNYAGNDL